MRPQWSEIWHRRYFGRPKANVYIWVEIGIYVPKILEKFPNICDFGVCGFRGLKFGTEGTRDILRLMYTSEWKLEYLFPKFLESFRKFVTLACEALKIRNLVQRVLGTS